MSSSFDCKIWKEIHCEHCQHDFAYPMERSFVIDKAAKDRNHYLLMIMPQVKEHMRQEFDATPCPGCGRYQRDMLKKIRRRLLATPEALCVALMIMSVPVAIIGIAYPLGADADDSWLELVKQSFAAIPAFLLTMITFVTGINVVRFFYTPNPEKAMAKAAEITLSKQTEDGAIAKQALKNFYKKLSSLDEQVDQEMQSLIEEGSSLDTGVEDWICAIEEQA